MDVMFGLYLASLLVIVTAFLLLKNQTKKLRFIIWGVTTMLVIAPLLSLAIGGSIARTEENMWAAGSIFYIFPLIFGTGLIILIIGLFKEKGS
ncbi:hypothetical protein [Salsuginibacillus kocurii]|uniref:hypothetical protein n=1 Tax=Salsuginibacillus kocurii TaxID=427078 RepID=UPI0003781A6F|nr:hypothetical protein [Salsuginibacillus kocurii]